MIGHVVFERTKCIAFLLLLLLTFVSGCSNNKSKEVVVGSVLALSGPDQSFGITQRRGMEIALEEVNANGGINGRPMKIEFADSKLQEDLGLQEYKRLTGDKGVQAIVGITGSGVNLRLCPFANKDQVVLLDSLATSPKLTQEGGPFFFRNIASDAHSAIVLSNWAKGRGQKTAALIYNSENAWSKGLKAALDDSFPKSGGKWSIEPISVLNSTDNFNAAVVAIREASVKADTVFVCLMGRQAGLFVSQAKTNGLDVPFYGTDTFSQQEFIDNARTALEQSYFVLPAEEKGPRYQAFETKYRTEYKAEPDSIAAKAYDSVHVLAIALREADKTGELKGDRIRKALSGVNYDGITGRNAFDEHGDLKDPRFDQFVYKNGKRVVAP